MKRQKQTNGFTKNAEHHERIRVSCKNLVKVFAPHTLINFHEKYITL